MEDIALASGVNYSISVAFSSTGVSHSMGEAYFIAWCELHYSTAKWAFSSVGVSHSMWDIALAAGVSYSMSVVFSTAGAIHNMGDIALASGVNYSMSVAFSSAGVSHSMWAIALAAGVKYCMLQYRKGMFHCRCQL